VNGKRYTSPLRRIHRWVWGAVLVAVWAAGPVRAQTGAHPGLLDLDGAAGVPPPAAAKATLASPKPTAPANAAPAVSPLTGIGDANVAPASCATCGGGLLRHGDGAGCGPVGCPSIGCNGANCVPGRIHCCSICDSDTCAGRILCGLYECICCPDPCYEPHCIPAASAALFVDSARPINQTRLRYDGMFNIANADRAEYLMAHYSVPVSTTVDMRRNCLVAPQTGKGLPFIPRSVDLHQISLYTEAGTARFSAFVSMPYEHIEPFASVANGLLPNAQAVCPHSAFGDITVGTKSLLLDCDLLQFAFQFSSYLPSGNFTQGIGTSHVSLEPAILFTLKLTPDCYFQGEMAYWFPLGADPLFAGNVWHNHFSFNQVLCRILPDVPLIGTLECINYNVIGGNYTSTTNVYVDNTGRITALPVSGAASMFSIGPGLRLDVCCRLDVGAGVLFNTTGSRFANEEVRAEVRLRF
jgi:hypothetical protein